MPNHSEDYSHSDPIWQQMLSATQVHADQEPILASFLHATVLKHTTLESALSFHLANKLDSPAASALLIREIIEEFIAANPQFSQIVRADIVATFERDSACPCLSTPFLYYKGFHALQCYRVSHWLWTTGRRPLALFIQNQLSTAFGVDIHPAAVIGRGIMLDHATGIVIGETAVVGDNVSIMQSVTLGGTGKESGNRHPKIGDGVLIGPGAKIIGNITVGNGAHISAGSVVLKPVPCNKVVAGVPAKVIGNALQDQPALTMSHDLRCKE